MNKHVVETIGLPVVGPEEDYFRGTNCMESYGMSSILRPAGCEEIGWATVTSFEYPGDHRWEEYVEAYRRETGRQFPPLYRVKITVEAEQVPEEESDRYWKDVQERHVKEEALLKDNEDEEPAVQDEGKATS